MSSQRAFFIQFIVILIIAGASESAGFCSDDNTTNETSLLITFGSGSDQYSHITPAAFNSNTTHQQRFPFVINGGRCDFVDVVRKNGDAWHAGALDHTSDDDSKGYMCFLDIVGNDSELFNLTVNNICIGLRYDFFGYLANVVKKPYNATKPNIRFEVRTTADNKQLLAQYNTSDIPEYDTMTWSKCGLSFIASSSSVILLMVSNVGEPIGNDVAIDDIELRVSSNVHSDFCSPEIDELCSDNDTIIGKSLFLITFGSGSQNYSNETPSSFNFSTTYQQLFGHPTYYGTFDFYNAVPNMHGIWHVGALDQTENDMNGYMYLVDIGARDSQFFNLTVNNLCTGMRYTFSICLANGVNKASNLSNPNVRFEVRSTTGENPLLAQLSTANIPDYGTMTWLKYSLSFIASSNSVKMLMITNVGSGTGNDIAIDDIESHVCSTDQPDFCFPEDCNPAAYIGLYCNVSTNPCDMLQPCQNNGTCNNTGTTHYDYKCSCPSGFIGTRCEIDHRPCKPHTCLNHGKCNETPNTTFHCTCDDGWHGRHCQSMTNYCETVTCLNKGVCRPLLLNYTCECLGDSYWGRHCENTARKIIICKMVSTSLAYIAIIVMISAAMFIVMMDILKYCFGIDSVHEERERMRRKKEAKRRKRPVIQRFIYVNASSKETKQRLSTIIETTL